MTALTCGAMHWTFGDFNTLLSFSDPVAANRKPAEHREPAANRLKQADALPPASPADNVENKK